MSTESAQNQIKETQDQVSLDYADGKYLNVISGNLGLNRPLFGFSDDVWRAITRAIALQFKQITNKFRQVLELLVGPQTTRIANPTTDYSAGTQSVVVADSSDFPDVGTLIWDEGISTEETINYCFIDRVSNTIFLETNTVQPHAAVEQDAETLVLVAEAGDTEILVSNAQYFPQSGYPYPLVVGRGTDNEETVELQGVDIDTKTLTVSALANTHESPFPKLVSTTMSSAYAAGSFFLVVDDVSAFPDSGTLILEDSATTFAATGGSTTSVSVAASTFSRTNGLTAYKVAFDGNITAALAEVEIYVQSNTDSLINFFTTLGTAPVAGDTFTIRPIVEFTGKDATENTLNLRNSIAFELASGVGTQVECLDVDRTAALGILQVKEVEWDIYDNGSGLLEIFVPETEEDRLRLIDAAYLHPAEDPSSPATLVRIATTITTDPATLYVDSTIGFAESGVLELPAENIGYVAASPTFLAAELAVGATSMVVDDSSVLPGVGGVIDIDVNGASAETATVITNDTLTNTVTFAALSNAHLKDAVIREAAFSIPHGFTVATPALSAVSLYEPLYAGTDLFDGGGVITTDIFEGSYLYDDTQVSHTAEANTTLAQALSGPTRLAITLSPETGTKTAVEVENGTAFPLTGTFEMTVGLEEMVATEVSLKQRCESTFASPVSPGVTTLPTSPGSLRPGLYDGSDFPLARGYRIVLDRGTIFEEIVFVDRLDGDDIILDAPTSTSHDAGDLIELYSDTITVQQIDAAHTGVNDYSDRARTSIGVTKPRPATINNDTDVTRVTPKYDSITVTSGGNYPPTGGTLIIGAGTGGRTITTESFSTSAGASIINCLVSAGGTQSFPTVYPYWITIEPGSFREETVEVTQNDTGNNRFILFAFGAPPGETKFTHAQGSKVQLEVGSKEVIPYDSVSGNVISFSDPIMVQSTHQAGEKVSLSAGTSEPSEFGTDHAFRMPPDLLSRVKLLFDLIRAAGVEVRFIRKK